MLLWRFGNSYKQFRQLRDVRRDPPCLVACENLRHACGLYTVPRINVGERLPIGINYLEAAVCALDGSWCGEAAHETPLIESEI